MQQIDLLPNPTAKYDASGNGGVIVIRMKKNVATGFNGSLTALYGHGRYGKTEERLNVDYRRGKFNLSAFMGYNQQNNATWNDQDRAYLNPDGSPQSYYALNNFTHNRGYTLAPYLSLDYYATDKTTLGLSFGGLYKPLTSMGTTVSHFAGPGGQPDSTVSQSFRNPRVARNGWANLNYRHQFDKNGQELTADLDYNRFDISSSQLFVNSTLLPDGSLAGQSQETGSTPSNIYIYAFKTDYTLPLKNGYKLETGIKTSFTRTDNPAAYFNTADGITEPDYTKTNHFIYDENINAAYINASKDWKRFGIELGLRAENTNAKGNQLGNALQADSSFTRRYTGLFPTLFLQYKLDTAGASSLGFNYGRRINRPNYQDLNPFIIPQDAFNYNVGNPFLNPSYTQNLELSYNRDNDFTAKVFYGRSDGDIQGVDRIEGGILYHTLDNLGYFEYDGLSLEDNFSPLKWLRLSVFGQLKFEHTEGLENGLPENIYGTVGYLDGNLQFNLGKGWNAGLNGFYQTKTRNFLYNQDGLGRLNALFQKKLSNSFSARVVFTDFLGLYKTGGTYNNLPLTNASFRNQYDFRGFNVSLTYRFGKIIKDLRRHEDDASKDEQNRVVN